MKILYIKQKALSKNHVTTHVFSAFIAFIMLLLGYYEQISKDTPINILNMFSNYSLIIFTFIIVKNSTKKELTFCG